MPPGVHRYIDRRGEVRLVRCTHYDGCRDSVYPTLPAVRQLLARWPVPRPDGLE